MTTPTPGQRRPQPTPILRRGVALASVLALGGALATLSGEPTAHATTGAAQTTTRQGQPTWVGTWSTAVAVPQSGQALAGFTDTTLRQRIHVSVGGDVVRLRLSNVYGKTPLAVSATVASPATGTGAVPGDIDAATLAPVTFSGRSQTLIPAGAELVSDPVPVSVPDDGDLIASLHVPGPTGPATYHAAAHATGWIADGDHTSAASVSSFPRKTTSSWFLDGLDVQAKVDGSVAFLGDSITDGSGSTTDADHRWTDYLADRVVDQPRPQRLGVLNAGIGGNRVLLDASSAGQGVNALARLERDVLTQTGVETVVVFEGVNDIQQNPSEYNPDAIVAGYQQILQRAHDRGLRVVVATITPFEGWSKWTPEREAVRVAVNEWIRTSGEADAVIDFDAVVRDPAHPTRLLAAYDSGDHLHPNDGGYAAMGAAVDLRALDNVGR